MKLFDIFKKKKEKTILERSLEEVARVGKDQPVKGVEVVDEYYRKHPFNKKIVENKRRKKTK